jgi:uncharacterized DUF497 family protein
MGGTDDFEWDDAKDAITWTNRDLELVAAARMFDGRPRLERASRKSPDSEVRYETMAEVEGRVLFCVWTWRWSAQAHYFPSGGSSERAACLPESN